VRELENCITRAVVLATGNVLHAEQLGIGTPVDDAPEGFATLEQMEADHLRRALAASGGNKTRAAELLGHLEAPAVPHAREVRHPGVSAAQWNSVAGANSCDT
jgi:DNA-binding NtrC family response regulator